MKLWRILSSAVKSLAITLQRSFDHTYRRLVGVPTHRYSEITPQLYLGGQYSKRGFAILKKRGITGIVSMRTTPRKELPDLGEVHFLHLPTPDQKAPALADLQAGVAFMDKIIRNDGKVYVHCWYGEGRGPSMVAAYLISTGLTLDHALDQIRAVRGFIKITNEQTQRLVEFEQITTSLI
ncbi:MAG: dual specificity protein phosphatase family protein [bacterium]|nr:dual specificity protein phosphatase family protein [bacterium]